MSAGGRGGKRGLAPKVLTALLACTATLALVEVAGRVYLSWFAGEATFVRYASLRQLERRFGSDPTALDATRRAVYSPHRYLGYYPTPGWERGADRHNRLGFRGAEIPQPKPPGEFRIVCLGGSTTYTSSVADYRLSYPDLLQLALQRAGYSSTRVINAGSAGWCSLESLINLELRVLDLAPDAIVVYHGINDVDARLVWPPESYRGDDSGRRRPAVTSLRMPGLLEYSTVGRALLIRAGLAEPHASFRRTVDERARTYYGDLYREQRRRGSYPDGFFREVSVARMLEANPPVYFRRNLEHIVALAESHGVRPVLMTFGFTPAWPERSPELIGPEVPAALREMNRVVTEVAAERGAALVDLAALLPQDRELFFDGVHVTPEGSARMAGIVARGLIDQGVVAAGAGAPEPR